MTSNQEIILKSEAAFIGTYTRFSAAMVKGHGCRLEDADGKSYLDFLSGIAVCSLGHCHPEVTKAICDQAQTLVHVSNLFHTIPQTELATLLVKNSFADRVFFANSGAEANEAAIKLARKQSPQQRYEVITLEGSFHGRTLATIAATGQPKFREGFEPMPIGFKSAPFGDMNALSSMINETTCAIMVEPLQGESGVRPLSREYLANIRELCDRHELLLIFDEVQVGMGRTGSLFAYEQLDVKPDIMTLAKALGNGLPLGAMLTTDAIAAAFGPGTHASTFGGNPVSCAAGLAVMNVMLKESFMANVLKNGQYLTNSLQSLAQKYPSLATGTRGSGLIQALVLTEKGIQHGAEIIKSLFQHGLLANFAGNSVLRFIPPLIVTESEINEMRDTLDKVLATIS